MNGTRDQGAMRINAAFHQQSVFRDEKQQQHGICRTICLLGRDLPFLPVGRAGAFHGVERESIEIHSMARVPLGPSSQCLQSVICWLLLVSFFCFSRIIADKVKDVLFTRPRKYIRCSMPENSEFGYVNIREQAASMCRYDLDDMDTFWLQSLNEELTEMGKLFSHS